MINDYEFEQLIENTIKDYHGNATVLISAVGALVVGRYVGWRVISLILSQDTLRKYQNSVGVIFKDVLPERGKYAYKSIALSVVDKFNNFWQVVQNRDKSVSKEEKTLFS